MKKYVLAMIWILTSVTVHSATAPDFNLPTPEGKRITLSELLKTGPVLIDFWATWCKPCIEAMPKLEETHQKYHTKGLTVIGINEDGPRGQNRIRPFLKSKNISFAIAIDADGSVMKRLQVQSLPTTLLIGQDGEIVLRQAGYTSANEKPLVEAIEALFSKPEDIRENK